MHTQKLLTTFLIIVFTPATLSVALLSLISRWVQDAFSHLDLMMLIAVLWMNEVLRDAEKESQE